jgi:16S rRNA (uracil1498-N3)-methyltransferase
MQHFFVPPAWLQRDEIHLIAPLAHQLSRVLRARAGEHIILLDDSGWAYEVELDRVTPDLSTAHIVAQTQPPTEPRVRLTLYQALTREKKFDWVLQKGTELGVSSFVPLVTQRGLINERDEVDDAKLARWQRIVTEAAEQAGRARRPQVLPAQTLRQACRSVPTNGLALIAWVGGETIPLRAALCTLDGVPPREICLFIGPEGDFTPEEVADARQAGILPVSLGARILRTETAGLAALAAILYALGELG